MKKMKQFLFVLVSLVGSIVASEHQERGSLNNENELDLNALELGALADDEQDVSSADDEAVYVGTDRPFQASSIPLVDLSKPKKHIVVVAQDGTYESAEFNDLTDYYEPREGVPFSELSTKNLQIVLDQASRNSDEVDSQ